MKLGDILKDANSNLLRNKVRTLLTVIAIFIGAMTLTITNGIGAGISDYIDKQVGNIGAEDVLIVRAKDESRLGDGPQKYNPDQDSSRLGGGFGPSMVLLQDKDIEAIEKVKGVLSAEAQRNVSTDYIEGSNNEKYQLTVVPYIDGTNLALANGALLDNQSERLEIVLPPDYPAVLGFSSAQDAVGKQVRIAATSASREQETVEATVVGVQEETLASIGGASINRAALDSLYEIQSKGLPDGAQDGYLIVLARVNKDVLDTELTEIKNELDTKGYTATTVEDQIGAFKQAIDAIIMVLNIFAGIALLAASFGIVNTLLMSVQERTKEIGLMKAMGLGKNKIFLLFSIEAILLGFWGSLLGSLAGIGVGQVANRVATDTFLKDLPGFTLTIFSVQSVVIIMLIIMAIAFIAGTLPASRAARKDPIEALRYE